jgi:hypothetical protein
MKQALAGRWCLSSWSCRFRSSPAFDLLSHSASRPFHLPTKSRPVPPSALEKVRASTTTTTSLLLTLLSAWTFSPASATPTISGFRFFSTSPSPLRRAMADQIDWTGPKVRQTFLDYFAERGHTVGELPRHAPRALRWVPARIFSAPLKFSYLNWDRVYSSYC